MTRPPRSGATLLLGAAIRVERCGLARGTFTADDGSLCGLAALLEEAGVLPGPVPWWEFVDQEPPWAYMVAIRALAQHLGWDVDQLTMFLENQLMAWFDSVPVDAAEVADTFRSAAQLARGLSMEVAR